MLTQKFFGCPAVMVVFRCQMQNLVSSGTDSRRPVGIDHQMRIVSPRAHDGSRSFKGPQASDNRSCEGSGATITHWRLPYLTLIGKSVEFLVPGLAAIVFTNTITNSSLPYSAIDALFECCRHDVQAWSPRRERWRRLNGHQQIILLRPNAARESRPSSHRCSDRGTIRC